MAIQYKDMFFHCSSSILWPFINGRSIAGSTQILHVQIQLKGGKHDFKTPDAHAENAGWLGTNHEIVHFLEWFCLNCSTDLSTNWASHKSNPSSVPRGIIDSYSSLPFVTWVEVVEGMSWWGLLQHMLANGDLVYPSQGGRYCTKGCMALG
jgi:hypothetical protein